MFENASKGPGAKGKHIKIIIFLKILSQYRIIYKIFSNLNPVPASKYIIVFLLSKWILAN